jgi:hypothetical protein
LWIKMAFPTQEVLLKNSIEKVWQKI